MWEPGHNPRQKGETMKLSTFEKVNTSHKTAYVVFDGSSPLFTFTWNRDIPSNNSHDNKVRYSALMGTKAWVSSIHVNPNSGLLEVTVQLRKENKT